MKMDVYDMDGNYFGEHENVDTLEVYMPVTIEHLANEYGIRLTTHGEPRIFINKDGEVNTYVIREKLPY